MTNKTNGKRRLLVTIESFDVEIGDHETNHMATFSISYHNLNQVKQVLRTMYDHNETKYRVKMEKQL